jgi:hypothetical protein
MDLVKEQFDPNKAYKWTQTDVFELSGAEFGILLNSLRAILSTEEAQRILLISKANEVIEKLLAKNVEAGIIKESTDEKQ